MQNWQKLCVVSGIGGILNALRLSHLAVDTVHSCIENLITRLQPINAGHFLVFIFKSVLKHYEGCNFDCFLRDLKYLHKSLDLILKKQILTGDRFYGQWNFDEHDAKTILQYLKDEDLSSLANLLEARQVAENLTC